MTYVVSNVSVSSHRLVRLILLAIQEVPGVVRVGVVPQTSVLGVTTGKGAVIRMSDRGVSANCYIVALLGVHLVELGVALQATVAAVIQDMTGLVVREVNVYIQDVEAKRG
ncbi:MAG: Asp23/Gls24 family envelope stress response protein [Chloroflexi bacterium AL-W]|nr:Asp23/Gls24 family envelope stress response protein [Chloroflexi bacterium AL-N1]NOK69143.1 Asp23/Gls24 family envelope stress response protein [Chloroflexi bacterium AL-N10]NOK77126.1 Asp23/Gls24 family envelope stress response protein [Chloroflexi bacterium AL-N5]NOK83771.1 Asp23/Gls24 family envelope stress response protein [Chloroflexi bacterium AL-W]NOK90981.1 Asp23/Gls24 family envelope stress response protein [Chloroflexi bacterium AL-N15]